MAELRPIPIIGGPTGSGKTSVAVELASDFPIEVVSADSRQILKYLDIGTAKPTKEEQEAVRFHLIDFLEPGERYSAFQFVADCDAAVAGILARNRIPVVVGGTGLYLRALTEGVIEIEQERPEIRRQLEDDLARLGPEAMHRRLAELDPDEAGRIHVNNRIRVLRALEIYGLTGKTKSELMASGTYKKSSYAYSYYCLMPDREALYERINRRVDEMISEGLVEELGGLVQRGLADNLRRANVIGYQELLEHIDGLRPLDEAVAMIKQNSRRYAKRQITWIRHQTEAEIRESREDLRAAVAEHLLTHWEAG